MKSYSKKLITLLIILTGIIKAQIFTQQDATICNTKIQIALAEKVTKQPIGDVITNIGKTFIGTMYESHTLEKGDKESLVINLTGLDCTTYLENCLVLARVAKMKKPSFTNYMEQLQLERYRNGKIDGYTSRLHYFTDWVYDGEKKGLVKDITKKLGGIPYDKKIDFMTTHRDAYTQLKDDNFYNEIKNIESEINKRKYYYIPKKDVAKISSKLKNGDLIATTTSIPGLDVSHVAVIIKMPNGETRILHAPEEGKRVQISYTSLSDYLAGNKNQTGIIVARPLEPKSK